MAENNERLDRIDATLERVATGLERLKERHEALAQSLELMKLTMEHTEARERRGRLALLAGIQAYLEALNEPEK